jgi:hypothetical protein
MRKRYIHRVLSDLILPVQLRSDRRMVHRHRRWLVSIIVLTIQLGYLENLNHDMVESLNMYATPRAHPRARGRICKTYKLSKVVSI